MSSVVPRDLASSTSERASASDLEAQIAWATLRLQTAKTPKQRRTAANEQARLVRLRSMEQVENLERAKGLR